MEKINAKITILFSKDGLNIEIYDDDACITFVKATLNEKQACQALSRLAFTQVADCVIRKLDLVGKKMEQKEFEFQFDGLYGDKVAARQALKEKCPEGWVASTALSSQDSFFTKGAQQWARTSINRWVAKEG